MTIPTRITDEARKLSMSIGESPSSQATILELSSALLAAEQRGREKEREKREDLEDVLHQVKQWCDAYPLDIFPEPDFKHAHELLTAGGMTLDAISASNMRHVCTGISKIIAPAIRSRKEG